MSYENLPPLGSELTVRSIILTILIGFLNLGRVTSIAVFVYALCANGFFLVSP